MNLSREKATSYIASKETAIPCLHPAGEPRQIKIEDDIDEMTGQIWDSLNEDNRISLYVSYRDLKTGTGGNPPHK